MAIRRLVTPGGQDRSNIEVGLVFGGRSTRREALEGSKRKLEELHQGAQTYTGSFELPEAEEDLVGQVSEVLRQHRERQV
ncbi:MAG: hypothetical protein WBF37_12705 [Dehalococcoidia bacterium]